MTEPTAPRDPTEVGPVGEARLLAGQELARTAPGMPRHEAEAIQQGQVVPPGGQRPPGADAGGADTMAQNERRERRLEQQIQVREVTHVQGSWTEQVRGAPGAFTLQLLLDHGADEYVLRPTAQDAQVLLTLLGRGTKAFFDLERKVLLFGNLTLE